MDRRKEALVGIALLALAVLPLSTALLAGVSLLLLLGFVWAAIVAPVAYKLLRYPSLRSLSPGTLARRLRRARSGVPFVGGGMLVSFSGIDGSGKSTQAALICDELREFDVDATKVWARWEPRVSYPLMGFLFVLFRWRRKDYRTSPTMRRVWPYFVLADQLVFAALNIYPALLRGRVVCVDRYLIDQFVELSYDGMYTERVGRLFRKALPEPDVAITLDVSVETALERKDDTAEMLERLHIEEDAETYLTRRRELLHEHSTAAGAIRFDTEVPAEETYEQIRDVVFDHYFS